MDGSTSEIIGEGVVDGYDDLINCYWVILDNGDDLECQPESLIKI